MSSAGGEAGGVQEMSFRLCMPRCVWHSLSSLCTALVGRRQLWLSRGGEWLGGNVCVLGLEHRACLLPQPQPWAATGI